jgi:hypothetical protein
MITAWILVGIIIQSSAANLPLAVIPPAAVHGTEASCENAKREIISLLSYSKLKCIQIQLVK